MRQRYEHSTRKTVIFLCFMIMAFAAFTVWQWPTIETMLLLLYITFI